MVLQAEIKGNTNHQIVRTAFFDRCRRLLKIGLVENIDLKFVQKVSEKQLKMDLKKIPNSTQLFEDSSWMVCSTI